MDITNKNPNNDEITSNKDILSQYALGASKWVGRIINKLFSKGADETTPAGKTIIAAGNVFIAATENTGKKILTVVSVAAEAATKTRAFVQSDKTRAFFIKSAAGQAVAKFAADSISEIGASLIVGRLVSDGFDVCNGSKDLSSLYANSLPQTVALLWILSNVYDKQKVFKLYETIMTYAILTTLVTQSIKLDSPSTLQNVGQYVTSFMASIMAGYQVSNAESGLSFKEYLDKNLRSVLATGYINFNYSSAPALVRAPFNIIAGPLAYNSTSLYELITKIMTTKDSGKRKDLALRAKEFLKNRNETAITKAINDKESAEARKEDLTAYDAKIAELQNQSTIMKTLEKNLGSFLRIGFKTFNDYQKILTDNPAIAKKQSHLIDIYRKAAKFEKDLKNTGIESTEDYKEKQKTQPDLVRNLTQFIRLCRESYQRQKEDASRSLSGVLKQAISVKQTWTDALMEKAISPAAQSQTQLFDSLPQIQETESALLGFSITDSTNEEITKELIKIHLLSFFSLGGPSITKKFLSAALPEALSSLVPTFLSNMFPGAAEPAAESATLGTDDDVKLAEGLLNLVMSHYNRVNTDSQIVRATQTVFGRIFPFLRTSLNEGPTATLFPSWAQFQEDRELEELITEARAAHPVEDPTLSSSWVEVSRSPTSSPTPGQPDNDNDFEMIENILQEAQVSAPAYFTQETQTDGNVIEDLEQQVLRLTDDNEMLTQTLTQNQQAFTAEFFSKQEEINTLSERSASEEQTLKEQERTIKHLKATLTENQKTLEDHVAIRETDQEVIDSLKHQLKEAERARSTQERAFLERERELQELAQAVSAFYTSIKELNTEGLLAKLAEHESFRPIAEHTHSLARLGERYANIHEESKEE